MTEVQKKFIKLLKSAVNREKISINATDEEWKEIYKLSHTHSVMTMLYFAVSENKISVPEEFNKILNQSFYISVTQLANQQHWAKIIFSEFDAAGIKYLPLKGTVIRSIYPHEEMRTSCDIDVFYDSVHTEKAKEIMEKHGFSEGRAGENHYEYNKGAVCFELHFLLTSPNKFLKAYYENIWERLENTKGKRYDFSTEDCYIYILLHLVKHFLSGGGGMRAILDIYLYNRKYNLNKDYLNKELKKLGILTFTEIIEKTAEFLFGEGKEDNDVSAVTEFLLSGNTYGTKEVGAITKHGSKTKYIIYRIFPPREKMEKLYPSLKGKKYLLPFFYIKRWLDVLFTRKERIKSVVNTAKNAEDTLGAGDIIKSVGLDYVKDRFF